MVENLIHLNTESPSELPNLDNPDNNADKEMTAEGTEENNSTNTGRSKYLVASIVVKIRIFNEKS